MKNKKIVFWCQELKVSPRHSKLTLVYKRGVLGLVWHSGTSHYRVSHKFSMITIITNIPAMIKCGSSYAGELNIPGEFILNPFTTL